MLWLFIDMGVLWLLLNMFSDESWDDQKLKVFGIAAAISILGGESRRPTPSTLSAPSWRSASTS